MAIRCDRVLDLAVLAFAAWTAIYQACLVLHLRAEWAVAAEVLVLGPCLAVAFGGAAPPEVAQEETRARAGRLRGAVLVAAALTAAGCIAFLHAPWPLSVGAWLVAAAVALSTASGRPGRDAADGVGTALAWTAALAALSLFLVNPNADDSEYVHLSSWVAAHGSFPVGDTLFSDQSLPAIFFPPLNSYEALVGAFAHTTELQARDVVYFAVPPAAAALSVLALWRLLRGWRVRSPALALSLALGFLLMDAAGMRTFGSFWLARMWQGKVIFVAVLVPLLLALLLEHAERPSRRGVVLLVAAGVAAVGLTTTAMFVVPVLAAGCLAPQLRSARRPAAVAVGAALIVWGTPLWSSASGSGVTDSPRWKLSAHVLAAARTVLGAAHPGDVILAPRPLSRAILKLSGTVVVVDPVDRYVRALRAVPGAHARERVLLEDFAGHGVARSQRRTVASPPTAGSPRRCARCTSTSRASGRGSAAHGRCCEPTASPWSRRRGGPRACAARRRRRCHDHARCPGARGSSCWPRSRWAAAAVSRR